MPPAVTWFGAGLAWSPGLDSHQDYGLFNFVVDLLYKQCLELMTYYSSQLASGDIANIICSMIVYCILVKSFAEWKLN